VIAFTLQLLHRQLSQEGTAHSCNINQTIFGVEPLVFDKRGKVAVEFVENPARLLPIDVLLIYNIKRSRSHDEGFYVSPQLQFAEIDTAVAISEWR
jgi:hypothetical protein